MSYVAQRPSASAPTDGSRTITIRDSQPREEDDGLPSGDDDGEVGTLRLRGGPRQRTRNRPRVVWKDDVVDNEGAGKKSSKICCIYHKPKRFDESSSEESSDSDSDSSCDHNHSHSRHGPARPRDGSEPTAGGEGTAVANGGSSTVVHDIRTGRIEPNAYERAPGKKSKKGKSPVRNPDQA